MNFEKIGLSSERPGGARGPRIRAGVILAASLATGVAAAVAAAAAFGPFGSLRPNIAAHLVQSNRTSHAISAQLLFPKPGPMIQAMPRPYTVYAQPAPMQHSGPPTVAEQLGAHVEIETGQVGVQASDGTGVVDH